jgi:4-diphosphocytidyl-2-C-methyl-D-erythritol kinase
MSSKIKCPAKINLFLNITNKRPDGFHELESLITKIDLFDELLVEKSTKFSLEINGEFAEFIDIKNNLFTKILDYFVKNFNINSNLKITLQKNIPVGAGLGGGSSNGAYFIKILNEIFALKLSKNEMQKISLNFGSDIAFFFENEACLMSGRGEFLSPISQFKNDLKKLKILLINPKIHLSTKEIFQDFTEKKYQFSSKISEKIFLENSLPEILQKFNNDLEEPAILKAPAIVEILQNLRKFSPICAKMSGSGSSCFAIFDNDIDLQKTYEFFIKNYPNFFVKKVDFCE